MNEGLAFQYLLAVAGALLAIIWGMLRLEAKKTEEALDKKASSTELADAKANHATALRDVKEHFNQRLRELHDRQDREIDWLKQELGKMSDNLQHMRQEQNAANDAIMRDIRQLAITLQGR